MTSEKLRKALDLPATGHIGVVVRDIKKAIDHYSSLFGIGPFEIHDFTPTKHWLREVQTPMRLVTGHAWLGNIELELMQPMEGESIIKEFLETNGEGMHHIGFQVPDYDEFFEKFTKAGFKPLSRLEAYIEEHKGHSKGCFFDTRSMGGVIFEIGWLSWRAGK